MYVIKDERFVWVYAVGPPVRDTRFPLVLYCVGLLNRLLFNWVCPDCLVLLVFRDG